MAERDPPCNCPAAKLSPHRRSKCTFRSERTRAITGQATQVATNHIAQRLDMYLEAQHQRALFLATPEGREQQKRENEERERLASEKRQREREEREERERREAREQARAQREQAERERNELLLFENKRLIFENQSRGWLEVQFSYCAASVMPSFSDESGTASFAYAFPRRKDNEWEIDRDYTACNAEGWSFAANLAGWLDGVAAKSTASEAFVGCYFRRRVWKRIGPTEDERRAAELARQEQVRLAEEADRLRREKEQRERREAEEREMRAREEHERRAREDREKRAAQERERRELEFQQAQEQWQAWAQEAARLRKEKEQIAREAREANQSHSAIKEWHVAVAVSAAILVGVAIYFRRQK